MNNKAEIISFFKKGDSRTINVKRNAFKGILYRCISILLSMIMIPLTIGYVSSEIYGVWLTISSIIVWLGFFDVGFSLGLKNRLAEACAANNIKKAKSLVSTTYALMTVVFIPLAFVVMPLIGFVDWSGLLNVNPVYGDEIKIAMSIVVVCFCIQMIANVLVTILSALQQVSYASLFNCIANGLSLVLIYVYTKTVAPSLVILSLTLAASPIVVLVIASCFFYKYKLRSLRPAYNNVEIKYVKDIFNLGYKFFILQIQVVIVSQTANFLISYISGPETVTTYNIANKLLGLVPVMFNIVLNPLWPAFTDAYVKQDYQWMSRIYKKMLVFCSLAQISVVIMTMFSDILYDFWIGEKVSIPFSMTICVCLYYITSLWLSLHVTLINGMGKIQLQTYVAIVYSILHIPFSLLLGCFIGGEGVIYSLVAFNLVYGILTSIQIGKLLNKNAVGIWMK